ncbi:MAG: hypothetical protein U0354_01455 [Candidatus Sericytochromatia bacterium]
MKKLLALLFCLNIFACDSNTTQTVIVNPVVMEPNNPSENNSIPKKVLSFHLLPDYGLINLKGCSTFKFDASVKYTNGTADSDIVWNINSPNMKISNDGSLTTSNVDWEERSTLTAYPRLDPSKKGKYLIIVSKNSEYNKDCSKK